MAKIEKLSKNQINLIIVIITVISIETKLDLFGLSRLKT